MSGSDKAGAATPSKSKGDKPGRERRGKPRSASTGDVGRALRSVYDETLREDVPDDFRDLLGKLA